MAKTTAPEEMTVDDLRERAKRAGIGGTSHMRKDELLQALGGTDAIALLKADHREVERLFDDVLDREPGDPEAEALATQICDALTLHTKVEEELFYPAVKQAADAKDEDDARDEVLESYVEHGGVKDLIAKIRALPATDEAYIAHLHVLCEMVSHHVEEEEARDGLFADARKLLGMQRLVELGGEIVALKERAG